MLGATWGFRSSLAVQDVYLRTPVVTLPRGPVVDATINGVNYLGFAQQDEAAAAQQCCDCEWQSHNPVRLPFKTP